MSTIEDKVVSLKFDNKQFQSGVSESLQSVEKLNTGLKMEGATQGLDNVANSARRLTFGEAISGAGNLISNMSVLGVSGIAALGGIASKAVSVGADLIKSLSIEPALDGFQEYEMQLNSVQTILANTASKGEDINSVNAALDELNTYADQTIYSFSEMTRNIGTFTAAGVGLKDSVSAIKGLSNLAAASGSTSAQASTAMYQLSQAIATGTVRLMDWNSVVNAGMGGEQFQEALKRTARIHGEAVDEAIAKEGSFRDSLQDGWLTSEVMLETLSLMTGDYSEEAIRAMGYTEEETQAIMEFAETAKGAATHIKTFSQLVGTVKEELGSGWATTWRIVLGDFEEAEQLWTSIGNVITSKISDISSARNKMLLEWKELGGRDELLRGLKNSFEALIKPIQAIGNAFGRVFSGPSAQGLYNVTKAFADFTATLVMNDRTMEVITSAFEALFSAAKLGLDIFVDLAKIVGSVLFGAFHILTTVLGIAIRSTGGLVGVIRDSVNWVRNWYESLNLSERAITAITNASNRMADAMARTVTWTRQLVAGFKQGFISEYASTWDRLTDAVERLWKAMKIAGTVIKDVILEPFRQLKNDSGPVGDAVNAVGTAVGAAGAAAEKAGGWFVQLKDKIVAFFRGADENSEGWGKSFADKLIPLTDQLIDKIDRLSDRTMVWGNTIANWVSPRAQALAKHVDELRSKWSDFKESLGDVDFSWTDKLKSAVAAVGSGIGNVFSGMKSGSTDWSPFTKAWNDLKEIVSHYTERVRGAISVTSQFVKNLDLGSKVSSGWSNFLDLLKNIIGFLAKLGEFAVFVGGKIKNALEPIFGGILNQFKNGDWQGLFDNLVKGGALATFVVLAKKVTDTLKAMKETFEGWAGIGDSVKGVIDGYAESMEAATGKVKAETLLIYAAAIAVLAASLWILAQVPAESVMASGIAIGVAFTAITKAMEKMNDSMSAVSSGKMIIQAAALILVCTSIIILGHAMQNVASLGWGGIMKGLVGVGAAIGMLVVLANTMGSPRQQTKFISFGLAMNLMAAATLVMTKVVKNLGEMDTGSLIQGELALAALLVIVGIYAEISNKKVSIGSALAFLAIAYVLKQLSGIISEFAAMPWSDYLKGVVMMGLVLAGLIVAMNFSDSNITGAATLMIAVLAVKMAASEIANIASMDWGTYLKGVTMMGLVLAALVIATTLADGGILGAAGIILTALAIQILVPALQALADMSWAELLEGLTGLGLALAIVVVAGYAATGAAVGLLALGVAIALIGAGVGIAAIGLAAFIEALTGLLSLGGQSVELFLQLCQGLIDMLPSLGTNAAQALINFCQVLVDNQQTVVDTITLLMTAIAQAAINSAPTIVEAFGVVTMAILDKFVELTPQVTQAAFDMIIGFIDTCTANMPTLVSSGANLILSFLQGLNDWIPTIADAATTAIVTFITAIGDNSPRVTNAAFDTAIKFINGLADSIRNNKDRLYDACGNLVDAIKGFIMEGIERIKSRIKSKAGELGSHLVDGIKDAIRNGTSRVVNQIRDLANQAIAKAKDFFGIHSPSRVFYEIGQYNIQGLANGLRDSGEAIGAISDLSDTLTGSMKAAMDGLDYSSYLDESTLSPEIKPVMNLDNITEGVDQMQQLLNQDSLVAPVTAQMASQAAAQPAVTAQPEPQATGDRPFGDAQSVVFNQYNTSPRELSTAEIYRQTHNQLSQVREAMYQL